MSTPRKAAPKAASRSRPHAAQAPEAAVSAAPATPAPQEEPVEVLEDHAVAVPVEGSVAVSVEVEAPDLEEPPVVEDLPPSGGALEAVPEAVWVAPEPAPEPVVTVFTAEVVEEEPAFPEAHEVIEAFSASAIVLVQGGHGVSARTVAYFGDLADVALTYNKDLLACTTPEAALDVHLASLTSMVDRTFETGAAVWDLVGATVKEVWSPFHAGRV
ncbi:hypothetical protein [Pararhodospirillum photometricum]|uniref:Phasin domain-containing protein n=1 Tax=Pararhodospirillum photometricum DSM 122 TaxID=1150469 RepID=H6SJK4_PARPM|nr:hypothetical protein [Pararhodospirillum photometricum]CCG08169.1 unnamed protein product [Pararhodospirillum photometricum DSM 122]